MERTPDCVTLLLTVLCLPRPALGYLDPGSGSLLLQVILGTALGGIVALGVFWRQIRTFVGRLFGRGKPRDEPDTQAPADAGPHQDAKP